MDSFKTFSDVIEYIEKNLLSEKEIDYNQISKIAGCPVSLFQRIFVFITGMTISEYIRRRKLTLAGYDILRGKDKIIDIALKYGFNSHVSFTRAFKEQHKASPSDVRENKLKLVECPPISFTNIRIVGGRKIMAEVKKIEYVKYEERKVVGRCRTSSFVKAGEDCWAMAIKEGVFDKLSEIDSYVCDDIDDYFGLGHMSKFDSNDDFQYVVGKFVNCDAPDVEGMYSEYIPAGTVAKIWIEADTLVDIIDCAYLLCSEAIEKTGYKIDYSNFYWCDVYTYKGYIEPVNNGGKIILDYLLPVVK